MDGIHITRAALHDLADKAAGALAANNFRVAAAFLDALRTITADHHAMPAGPGQGTLPGPITPANDRAQDCAPEATGAPLAPAAPAPAQAAGGTQQARARSQTRNTGRAGGVWTAGRLALLRRGWHEGQTARELLPALNALPAASPVASEQAIYNRADKLGLKRPPEVAARLLQRAGRLGAERAAAMAAAGVTSLGAKPLVWTTERLELGRRMWEAGEPAEAMLEALNALPAAVPIGAVHTIRTQAAKQRWQRPEAFIAAKRAGYAERMRRMVTARRAAAAPPAPAPQAPPPEPPGPPPTSIAEPIRPGDEKEDAFRLFAAGASVRAVAEQFLEDIGTVGAWHTEWRAQAQQKDRAA